MNPSLLLIPDRYKAAKLYSQIPDSGAGDLTFARNSNATRVNSAGLIEKVRTNTLTHSQEFTNAGSWDQNVTNITITAGQTDPNGGALGFLVTSLTTSNTYFYQNNSGIKTFSIFAKAGTRNNFSIINGTYNNGGAFDLATQTATSAGQGSLAKIESVGGGWFRCSVFMSSSSLMIVSNSNLAGTDNVIGDSLTYAFAQSETGDIATDYIPTTTAAVSVGITADIPRLDYTGGGCPSLLLEPQRTNGAPFSEQFDNAFWGKNESTILANTTATLDPAGYYGADKLQENTVNASHNFGDGTISATSGQTVTFSIFFKAAERTWGALRLYTGSSSIFGWYNLANGTLGTIGAGGTGTIVSYGNGWYRCSLTITMVGNSVTLPFVFTSTGNGVIDYAGTTGSGIYCFGAQHEIGSYATSYIPTLGSSVTRLADAASKTGISSLIGQSEGTLYAEIPLQYLNFANFRGIISASDGTFDNGAFVFVNNDGGTSNQLSSVYRSAGSTVAVFQAANLSAGNIGSTYKIAIAYKANDFVFYINGVQIGSDTSGSITGTLSQLDLGSISYTGLSTIDRQSIAASAIYPVRLSNSELASLTSL